MLRLLKLLFVLLVRSVRSRRNLILENLALWQQLAVLKTQASPTKACRSRQIVLGDLAADLAGLEAGFAVGTNAKKVASRALRGVFFRRRTSKMEIPVR
jgi:hypothetical protein